MTDTHQLFRTLMRDVRARLEPLIPKNPYERPSDPDEAHGQRRAIGAVASILLETMPEAADDPLDSLNEFAAVDAPMHALLALYHEYLTAVYDRDEADRRLKNAVRHITGRSRGRPRKVPRRVTREAKRLHDAGKGSWQKLARRFKEYVGDDENSGRRLRAAVVNDFPTEKKSATFPPGKKSAD